MLIPLRHENMEGRRWPVISIGLVLLNFVVFLSTHWQMEDQNPQRSEVRSHILLLAAMHPELSMPPDVQDFVTKFEQNNPGTWREAQSQTRDVADAWDAKIRLLEDPASLQREMDSLAEQFSSMQDRSVLEQYAFTPAHPKARSYLTANFLHGGWLHLIGNMWFLWLAGAILEDTWGRIIYPTFYLVAGAAALQFHAWLNPRKPCTYARCIWGGSSADGRLLDPISDHQDRSGGRARLAQPLQSGFRQRDSV